MRFNIIYLMQDERGVDGVIILEGGGNKKKVLVGTRLAATKERQSKHEEKNTQEEDFEKLQAGLNVDSMTKASFCLLNR